MKNILYFTLTFILLGCAGKDYQKLVPLSETEKSLEQFLTAACLSTEGQVGLVYFAKEEPKVSYESFFDKNYKNWGLAISIPFKGEEDLHLNWRGTFAVEGTIGAKFKSTSFNRVLRRYQMSRSEVMRGLNYWADTIDVIARARDPQDKINREKLLTRTELVDNKYVIKKEISENLHFSWSFQNLANLHFEQQVIEFFSPIHQKSIRFTFFVRECLK